LEEDSFKHLKDLEHLDLSDNDISEVHVDVMKYLKKLKKLDLENNGLSVLPTDFLKRNVDLKHLSLAGNNIEELPCEFLKYQYELVSFNITNNKFSSLPCHVISRQGEQLIQFDATNNLLHQRYNTDLSHKRGANFRLNKKGVKANGRVMTEILEDGTIEFVEGNENQIAGTMTMACQVCDKLPPRKILKKKQIAIARLSSPMVAPACSPVLAFSHKRSHRLAFAFVRLYASKSAWPSRRSPHVIVGTSVSIHSDSPRHERS